MKKRILTIAVLLVVVLTARGQGTSDGNVLFQNVNIAVPGGGSTGGGNGNGTYNVPFIDGTSPTGQGVGLWPGGAKAGLYLAGTSTPLATSIFGTAPNTSRFMAVPFSQP